MCSEPISEQNCRDRLLDVAERLFAQYAYDRVSTRLITQEAGVNLASIQYHFGSKRALFIETLRRLLGRTVYLLEVLDLSRAARSREEAAQVLCEFIEQFLIRLVVSKEPKACQLIIREVLSSGSAREVLVSEIVSSTVRDFIAPLHQSLRVVISYIAPDLSAVNVNFAAYSVIGQCFFYLGNRPYIETLEAGDISSDEMFHDVVHNVCTFSLRGLGCEKSFVDLICN